ncbi:phage tail fiber protein [Gordonia alkaliphila]|uniref:Uncharacterized protein n=1 Tax=Gordonia alkaliphila TaxID=1053547 RepID=A0ABP8ZK44_9ACTN
MPAGVSTFLANALLDHATGRAAYTKPTAVYARLHTGNPGAAGTANASAQTTRVATTFSAAAAGTIAMSSAPEFTLTATETINHVSFWDAPTGGNFLWSAAATVAKGGASGDIIRVATNTLSLGVIAS